jgi:predicted nucleic acid-binding protein
VTVVLDANVRIAHLNAGDALHQQATRMLLAVAEEPLVVSPLTRAEVLVGPARAGRVDATQAALNRLGVDDAAWSTDAPVRLPQLRAGTGRRLPDCCVLLAAQGVGGAVATYDERLCTTVRELGLDVVAG